MKTIPSLYSLLTTCNRSAVLDYLNKKWLDCESLTSNKEETANATSKFNSLIDSLILKKDEAATADQKSLIIEYIKKYEGKNYYEYLSVNEKNSSYVKPYPTDSDALCWGGSENDEFDCPEGHYNANWIGYAPILGLSGLNRIDYLFNDIILEQDFILEKYSYEMILAEILWEFTFYGFEESECQKFWDTMKDDVAELNADADLELDDDESY